MGTKSSLIDGSSMKESLKLVRNLISSPENWCQGDLAKDKNGRPVHSTSLDAVQWCVVGAACYIQTDASDVIFAMDRASRKLGYECCITLNNKSDHETVLKMIDMAIEGGDA